MLVGERWRETFDARVLESQYPPRWQHEHKIAIWQRVQEAGSASGSVEVSCWAREDAGGPVPIAMPRVLCVPRFFEYMEDTGDSWWMNFADSSLFYAYGSRLLAQDELQVLEHPILGSVREALESLGRACRTVTFSRPTPVLIRGAERRVRFATEPDRSAGRPQGLYGNRFAAATRESVMRAVEILEPARPSNILAMAAPEPGRGRYTRAEIEYIWECACTGFTAARAESARACGAVPVHIHTGLWGCGAFGGNRELMLLLQMAAAGATGIDEIHFHVADDGANDLLTSVQERLQGIIDSAGPRGSDSLVVAVDAAGYLWGESDGN